MSAEAQGESFRVLVDLPDYPDKAVISAGDEDLVFLEDGLDALRAEAAAAEITGAPFRYRSRDVAEIGDTLNYHRRPDCPGLNLRCPLPVARIMAAGVRLVAERLAASRAITGRFDPEQESREKRFRAMGAILGVVDPPAQVVEMVVAEPNP
jgi:hypothetical protein